MFSSTIGRGRFFLYSLLLVLAEVVASVACIMATTGFEGLALSTPGPSRQGLALAVLIVSVVFVVLRSNLAWRRSRDAAGSNWVLWSYIVFSALFALLQAGTLLVYDFDGDNSNFGLNLLGLVIFGLWFAILFARPAGGSRSPTVGLDGLDPEPRAERSRGIAAAPPSRPAAVAAPATRNAGSPARRGGFGKRGLA